ncbi:hypothetical protein FQV39_04415 [Bosea sp. F3-2]|uniref:hypothetical protein n=1 Tax=Bosea sp. F3-2 TaxID=2599640 RepID=UPI0011EC74B6|nr:hypothetical protein [Bosea sp. F3-2]QEL21905.1 hypothetical protein FQV39_04415 [Bosea sp. F3-2]
MTTHEINNPASDNYEHLRFWVTPSESRPYEIDLSEFARGGRKENVRVSVQWIWAGDYAGRPQFAEQIATYFRLAMPVERFATTGRSALRALFRFLDTTDPKIASATQLTDAHGVQLKTWLETQGSHRSTYKALKAVIERIRQLEGVHQLWWPATTSASTSLEADVDLLGVRRLFNALKAEGRDIKAMFREGERLAEAGRDPRGESISRGVMASHWESRENHAWLIRHLTAETLPERSGFNAERSLGLIKANSEGQYHLGPAYLAPGMTERGREGIVGKLRWFHPSYHDTAVFLWIFLLGTGWNLATALSLDVSSDEQWFDDHPHKPQFRVLHGYKGRAHKHVFALSLNKPEWHPFQIIRFMTEQTRVLRETIRRRLTSLQTDQSKNPSPAIAAEIDRLQTDLRSPWLYHCVNKTGKVSALKNQDSGKLNSLVRRVAERADLLEMHPSLAEMTTSVARDAWIGFAHTKSGHNAVLTQLAAQHENQATLRHYLGRRRYRTHSEAAIRRVQDAVFTEIETKRAIDPTRIRILVQNGVITPEQEKRLLDLRHRTRLGMGCLDPMHPPREVAPGHPQGTICAVQRCTGCSLGVVFAESLSPLARAKAELMQLRRQLPMTSWIGSSFEEEADSLDKTLAQFPAENVDLATAEWTKRIQNGELVIHDTFPSY